MVLYMQTISGNRLREIWKRAGRKILLFFLVDLLTGKQEGRYYTIKERSGKSMMHGERCWRSAEALQVR